MTPPEPKKVPIYLLQGLAVLVGVVGLGVITVGLARKLKGNGNGKG